MSNEAAIQYDGKGRLRHLVTLEGVARETIEAILDRAQAVADGDAGAGGTQGILANLFYEPSTRTRCSFEIAAGRLGWQVLNIAESTSSLVKGETLAETARTLAAMGVTALAIRHSEAETVRRVAEAAPDRLAVINAGAGSADHPTQGLLDALTIRQRKGSLENLAIAICGDVRHSRVARSDIHAFSALGASDIRLVGPKELLPESTPEGCIPVHDMEQGLRGADVVIMLRIQKERMAAAAVPDPDDYHRAWGLDAERLKLAKPDCLVMHPGPANQGVEITMEVLHGPQSAIQSQVKNGVYVRVALLAMLSPGD